MYIFEIIQMINKYDFYDNTIKAYYVIFMYDMIKASSLIEKLKYNNKKIKRFTPR